MNCPICDFPNLAAVASCRSCGSPLRDRSFSAASDSATSENVSTEDDDALPVGATLSFAAYRIERVLGQGGFGITYLCRDVRLERAVAIKEFFPSGCRRTLDDVRPSRALSPTDYAQAKTKFLEEARVLARFKHAGIVDVHTVFEENNSAYMVMEFLEGRSLSDLLQQRDARRMKEDEALHYIERAGDALNAVHERGLLHRDLKPDNIIACNDGRVMLIDFGTAREYSAQQTHGHTVVVTPGYAPLEQYAQQAKRGAYTDVYGLAATLYHLLTGEVPAAASDRAMGVELVPPRELNPHMSTHVARAIETALQIETNKRPQSAREFLHLLRDPDASLHGATTPESLDSDSENGWQKADAASPKGHLDIADLHETWAGNKQPSVDFSALIRARKDLLQSPDPDTRRFADFLATQPDATPDDGAATSKALDPQASNDWHNAVFDHTDQNLNTLSGKPLSPTNFLAAPNARGNSSQDGDSEVQSQSLAPFVPLKATQPVSALPRTPLFSPPIPYESSGPLVNYSLPSLSLFWRWLAVLAFLGWIFAMSISQGRVPLPHPSPPISYGFSPSNGRGAGSGMGGSGGDSGATTRDTKRVSQLNGPFVAQPEIVTMPQTDQYLGSAVFSPDARLVASYSMKIGAVKLWDVENKRLRHVFPAHKGQPFQVIFSPDGKRLVSLTPGDAVRVWDVRTGKLLSNWEVGADAIASLAFARDGNLFATRRHSAQRRSIAPILVKWDIQTGRQLQAFSGSLSMHDPKLVFSNSPVYTLSPDGTTWVTGDERGRVEWRDTKTGALLGRIKPKLRGPRQEALDVSALDVADSPDSSLMAHRNYAGEVTLFSPDRKQVLTPQPLLCGYDYGHRLAFSHDNSMLATFREVWSTKTGRLIQTLGKQSSLQPASSPNLLCLAFSSDDTKIIALNENGKLFIWRRKTPSELQKEKRNNTKLLRATQPKFLRASRRGGIKRDSELQPPSLH